MGRSRSFFFSSWENLLLHLGEGYPVHFGLSPLLAYQIQRDGLLLALGGWKKPHAVNRESLKQFRVSEADVVGIKTVHRRRIDAEQRANRERPPVVFTFPKLPPQVRSPREPATVLHWLLKWPETGEYYTHHDRNGAQWDAQSAEAKPFMSLGEARHVRFKYWIAPEWPVVVRMTPKGEGRKREEKKVEYEYVPVDEAASLARLEGLRAAIRAENAARHAAKKKR